jgi:predicted DNA-binding transcriptional regulator AlpA
MTAPERDVLVTVAEVSAMTGEAPGTLFNLRTSGEGPRTIRFGGSIVYRRSEVLAWMQQRSAS